MKSFSNWARTAGVPSRIKGWALAMMTDGGCGQGASVVDIAVVKYDRASFR